MKVYVVFICSSREFEFDSVHKTLESAEAKKVDLLSNGVLNAYGEEVSIEEHELNDLV